MCDESIELTTQSKIGQLLKDAECDKALIKDLETDNADLKRIITALSSKYEQIKAVVSSVTE